MLLNGLVLCVLCINVINNNNNRYIPKPVFEAGDVKVSCGIKQYIQTEKLQQIGQI